MLFGLRAVMALVVLPILCLQAPASPRAAAAPGPGQFWGRVFNVSHSVIADGTVSVNGQSVAIASTGRFHLVVPASPRYVMTVHSPGYAAWSQVFLGPFDLENLTLVRASTFEVDPTQQIQLQDKRRKKDCPGPLNEPKSSKPCGGGIEVVIPPNSLVDADGNAPQGNVLVSLATFDINAPQQMPGDRLVEVPGGGAIAGVMTSFGAGAIEVTAGGKEYNLRAGAVASVRIPVYPNSGGVKPPKSVPLLNFDLASGMWWQSGTLVLHGNFYIADLPYLSPINADQVGSPWACLRVTVSGEALVSEQMNMLLQMRVGNSATQSASDYFFQRYVPDFESLSTLYVIYALLPNTYVTIRPYNNDTMLPVGPAVTKFITAPQNPQLPNPPDAPYGACADQVFVGYSWQ